MPSPAETLPERYDGMWSNAIPLIRRGEVEIHPILANQVSDARRGFTLIARPNAEVTARVMKLLDALREMEPDQYFYTPRELHMTVLTLATATVEYGLFSAARESYERAAAEALRGARMFEINFRGVSASPGAVVVQGFPSDATLESVRSRLRSALHEAGLAEGLDTRYRLITAHITAERFRARLQNPAEFVKLLESYRNVAFGTSAVTEVEIVKNDWYMSEAAQEVFKRLPLEGGKS